MGADIVDDMISLIWLDIWSTFINLPCLGNIPDHSHGLLNLENEPVKKYPRFIDFNSLFFGHKACREASYIASSLALVWVLMKMISLGLECSVGADLSSVC